MYFGQPAREVLWIGIVSFDVFYAGKTYIDGLLRMGVCLRSIHRHLGCSILFEQGECILGSISDTECRRYTCHRGTCHDSV